MKFTYTAGFADDPWIFDVTIVDVGGTLTASVYRNEQGFVQLRKIFGEWTVYGPTPAGFYLEDIKALGDEIEKQLEKGIKKPE